MKIFISGSISIKVLDETHLGFLTQIIDSKQTILIGDAYGVDKAVQIYLSERNYQDVTVYFSGEKPRNNIGNWHTKQCLSSENLTGKAFYQIKDKAMAEDSDSGLMFWNGKSKGTKCNIDYMNQLNKHYTIVSREGLCNIKEPVPCFGI